ncbi:MAG: hypothetical protein PHI29_10910 [Gallionella sp.]|nr:hypothetical protein [Gallionella sp.]
MDKSVLQDIPPEAALAWLQQVPKKSGGIWHLCAWTPQGVRIGDEVVAAKDMRINVVQRLVEEDLNGGVIEIVKKNNSALTTAFSTNGRCTTYEVEYYGAPDMNRNERIRADMDKTLSALGALGVELGELPE